MPPGDCSRCLLNEGCLYPRLFETVALKNTSSSAMLLKQHQDAPLRDQADKNHYTLAPADA
jgi:hypothetical protein